MDGVLWLGSILRFFLLIISALARALSQWCFASELRLAVFLGEVLLGLLARKVTKFTCALCSRVLSVIRDLDEALLEFFLSLQLCILLVLCSVDDLELIFQLVKRLYHASIELALGSLEVASTA